MKLLVAKISFLGFLGLHLLAALWGWQIWPLTNYPMFSRSLPAFETFETIQVESVYPDFNVRWTRGMFNTGNPRDLRLLQYLNESSDKERLDKYLLSRAQNLYLTETGPQALRVLKAEYRVDAKNKKLEKKEMVLREIPFKTK